MKPWQMMRQFGQPTSGGGGGGGEAHPHWRIYVTDTPRGDYAALAEIEFRATAGGANQAVGGTASTNGQYSGAYAVENAFDGSASTVYASNANLPKWIAYQFPSPVVVGEVAIRGVPASYGVQNESPRGFDIEYSDDGVSWVTAKSVAGESTWAYGELRTFSVP